MNLEWALYLDRINPRTVLIALALLYLLTDRWSQNRTSFSLPQTTEFQNDLSLLQDLIIFSMNPPEQFVLPSYQRLFQLVRLADFIGCEKFLEMVAGRLGVVVLTIKYGVHWRNPLSITSD